MAVRPAGNGAYVSFLSRECDANLMQLEEFDKYPSLFRLENTARLFFIHGWPESDQAALADKLGVESIIYQLSDAVAINRDVEFYNVGIEISDAKFTEAQQEYLTVNIESVGKLDKLTVIGWTDDFR